MSSSSVIKQLSKLGNTPFIINNIQVTLEDNIFINIKDLNELRRKTITKLIELRENRTIDFIENINIKENNLYDDTLKISILVRNELQLKTSLEFFNRIYVVDKKLYEKYQNNSKIYYRSSRISEDIDYQNVLSTELGSLYHNLGIGDYYLNITNHETIDFLNKYNKINTLSVELDNEEITNIMNYYNRKCNLEILLYSRIELMITKYCPINYLANKTSFCNKCINNKCINNKYELVDRNNKSYPIITDIDKHLTHILDNKITNKIESFSYYYNLGIRNFRIELFTETEQEIKNIIKILQQKKDNLE